MKKIFPKEILENTVEVHQFKHSKKSSVIYTTILLAFVFMFASLPFIKIDIYSNARGIIKSKKERVHISSINSSKVIKCMIKPNKGVKKGDTLLVLDDYNINNQLNLVDYNISNTEQFVHDINYLLASKKISLSRLKSSKYKKEYNQYLQNRHELQTKIKKIKRDYERSKILFEKGVIAAVENENVTFEYELALSALSQLRQQQLNFWQAELVIQNKQLEELKSTYFLKQESKRRFTIISPMDGTLMNVIGIEEGSLVQAGVKLAEISPDSDLIAECYISPSDIGLINENNGVKFQMDAYNYNQWGLATGKIIEISKDIEIIQNTSVFKVRCKMDQTFLSLKNNFKGNLKKGMTFNARFKLTERTLFDLLYDNVDDWLNPGNKKLN